jgi:YD repeat-containing protein
MSSIARVLAALVMLALPAHAGEQIRFYAPDGRSLGAAVPLSSGSTRYYDARGRSMGTSTRSGDVTTIYDPRGRVVGRTQREGWMRND